MEKQINIYGPSGCLRKEAMFSFLDNQLPEPEKLLVQQHLESCEFCREAMEGLSMITAEKRKKNLDMIGMQYQSKLSQTKALSRKMVLSLAAALILLLIGIFTIFRYSRLTMVVPVTQQLNETKVPLMDEKESLTYKSTNSITTHVVPPVAPKMEIQKNVASPEVNDEITESIEDKPTNELMVSESAPVEEEEAASESADKGYLSKLSVSAARSNSLNSSKAGNAEKKLSIERETKAETTYYSVEQEAVFNNGDLNTFKKFVEEKINAESKGIAGSLTVTFTIDASGITRDVYVVKGLDAKTDSLVVKIIKNSPKWKPAINGGKEVNKSVALNLSLGKL